MNHTIRKHQQMKIYVISCEHNSTLTLVVLIICWKKLQVVLSFLYLQNFNNLINYSLYSTFILLLLCDHDDTWQLMNWKVGGDLVIIHNSKYIRNPWHFWQNLLIKYELFLRACLKSKIAKTTTYIHTYIINNRVRVDVIDDDALFYYFTYSTSTTNTHTNTTIICSVGWAKWVQRGSVLKREN